MSTNKKISPELILETDRVILRPISENDFNDLLELAQEQEMWKYFALNLADREHFQKWMDAAFADSFAGTRIPFSIIVKKTGEIAGSMSLMNISYHDLRTEIGSSWLGKDFRGTDINRHAKYAMMRYAFEELNFERVEFKTDVLNERAKQGLRKVGGKEEGVLRSHMTMWHGRRRDSIYFSVIKNEWPSLKQTIFKDIEGYACH
ncbi:MAG: GNAT family N-acetyltransferase [Bacteroidetes bacterium]|nr:MAG: GNAT family N-acetyltransferase [Bacteroidota bacterium]